MNHRVLEDQQLALKRYILKYPIAKIFEMILASQGEQYFELNELFHPSQHGFRKNYSCETRNCQLTFGKLSRIKYYHVKWTINNSLVKLISNFKLNTKKIKPNA